MRATVFIFLVEELRQLYSNPKVYIQRRGLRWSILSKFMKLRVSQIAALVPALGYMLLWSQKLEPWTRLRPEIGESPFLSATARIEAVYYGSILLMLGWLLFVVFCPRVIKRHTNIEDFLSEQLQLHDDAYVEYLRQEAMARYINTEKNVAGALFKVVPITLSDGMSAMDVWDGSVNCHALFGRSKLFKAHYLFLEGSKFRAALSVAILIAIGSLLIIWPSFEVFLLVSRKLSHDLIGGLVD